MSDAANQCPRYHATLLPAPGADSLSLHHLGCGIHIMLLI